MKISSASVLAVIMLGFGIVGCSNDKATAIDVDDAAASGTAEMTRLEKEHLTELVAYADSVNRGLREDTERGSARLEITGTVGGTQITVNHGSPGVRGRVIWNGLVSYDQVWVSGSHWATAVTFSDDVVIAGSEIPAGTYGFFTIPGREKWTLIVNKRYDQHLAEEYTESEDLVRMTVDPIVLDTTVQRLAYQVEELAPKQGILSMSWDKIRVELPFDTKR